MSRDAGRVRSPRWARSVRRHRVSDYDAALPWYERLLGSEPTFLAHATEAVWDLASTARLYIQEDAERAGCSLQTISSTTSTRRVRDRRARHRAAERETYSNGVRKARLP